MQSPPPVPDTGPDARPLRFDRPLVIVGGGRVDIELLRRLGASGAALVAADGGAAAVEAAGLVPDAIVGDLDSLRDREDWERRTTVLHVPEQVSTDFQKALRLSQAPVTLALGMTGRRLDHTLAALSALHEVAQDRRVILVDEVDMALAVSGPITFAAERGERVSLYPLVPVSFRRSEGLDYALDGLTLEPGGRLGTSNAAEGGSVVIEPADGTPWLLILGRERLWDMLARFG